MNFEERLLMELKAEVSERAEKGRARSRWFNRRGIAMVAGLAATAAAVAVVVPIVTGGGTAAFAVTKNTDGSVDVLIEEFRDPDKLEQALKEVGVTAEIQYRVNKDWDGPHCTREGGTEVSQTSESNGEPLPDARIDESWAGEEVGEYGVRLYPKRFAKDETLVLNAYGVGSGWQWVTAIYRGTVPECTWVRVETPDEPANPSPSANPDPSTPPESSEGQVTSTKG